MIRDLQRKLRSRTGASMILALLFLMFCSFVGGSVLVSATANAARVKLHSEQQDFLDQRSAALLLSDELRLAEGQRFRLYVLDADRSIQEGFVDQYGDFKTTGNKVDPLYEERVITFQLLTDANAEVTSLQQLMLQTTIWRYLRNNAAGEEVIVVVKDKNGSNVNLSSFWYTFPEAIVTGNKVRIPAECSTAVGGTMTVSAQVGPNVAGISSLPSYEVYFSSCGEKDASSTPDKEPADLFDFAIDFGDDSQLKMVMDGYSGKSNPIRVEGTPMVGTIPDDNDPTGQIKVTTISTQTMISWDVPAIDKGGA